MSFNLFSLISAFQAGKKLTNSKTWKQSQVRVSLLVTVISTGIWIAGLFGYKVELTVEEITQIAIAIGIVGGLFNWGATVATTTELGVQVKSNSQPGDPGAITVPKPAVPRSVTPSPVTEPTAEPKPDIFHNRSLG